MLNHGIQLNERAGVDELLDPLAGSERPSGMLLLGSGCLLLGDCFPNPIEALLLDVLINYQECPASPLPTSSAGGRRALPHSARSPIRLYAESYNCKPPAPNSVTPSLSRDQSFRGKRWPSHRVSVPSARRFRSETVQSFARDDGE